MCMANALAVKLGLMTKDEELRVKKLLKNMTFLQLIKSKINKIL